MTSVRVAVGVVMDSRQRVLIARRSEHQHQGGRWEFPGGKIESGETLAQALCREFREEVSIELQPPADLSPWMVIEHDYGDKQVSLEVARVDQFSGSAQGLEGQEVRWVDGRELPGYSFPAANAGILERLLNELTPQDIDTEQRLAHRFESSS